MSILNVEHLTHGFGDRAILHRRVIPSVEGRADRAGRSKWRRKVHFYEYCHGKAYAG